MRGHWRRLRKFLTLFLSLTKDVFVLCHKIQLLMTNGFVTILVFLVHFQASIVDNFGILAYIQVLIADKFGISAHIQALIADDVGIFNTLGKNNTIQGLNSTPPGSLLATLPIAPPIH